MNISILRELGNGYMKLPVVAFCVSLRKAHHPRQSSTLYALWDDQVLHNQQDGAQCGERSAGPRVMKIYRGPPQQETIIT